MEIDFSEKPEELGEKVSSDEAPEVHVPDDRPVEGFYNAALALKDHVSWVKNTGITNRADEKRRFIEARQNGGDFKPGFKFKKPSHNPETVLELVDALERETEKIDRDAMSRYNAKVLEPEDLQRLFTEIFEEYRLYIQLADTIEDRQKWREICEKLWPMLDEKYIEKAEKRLEKGFDTREKQEALDAQDLKSIWQEELGRLGIKWNVEVRSVNGCFNIPEERTVVAAEGKESGRLYSQEEAEFLTMHELFHVARSFNGIKASESSDFPPIIGLHTPFYDATEEGGAVYREKQTGVDHPEKGEDYYLKILGPYYLYNNNRFQDAAEKLVDLGATPERAFYLLARNREVLRHHIYLGGYWKHWKGKKDVEPLLIGKVNPEWAEKLWREVEAGGMLKKPPVTAEDLFDHSFKP